MWFVKKQTAKEDRYGFRQDYRMNGMKAGWQIRIIYLHNPVHPVILSKNIVPVYSVMTSFFDKI